MGKSSSSSSSDSSDGEHSKSMTPETKRKHYFTREKARGRIPHDQKGPWEGGPAWEYQRKAKAGKTKSKDHKSKDHKSKDKKSGEHKSGEHKH